MKEPMDAHERRAIKPVICYPVETLPEPDMVYYQQLAHGASPGRSVVVPPRQAGAIEIPAGSILRISCPDGAQVGDLNLFAKADLSERFYSGKTRALHGTHVTVGDRLWSCFPHLRPMATIVSDTLDWYGIDEFGGSVHDVIGTRCDPYTGRLLQGHDYHNCCHSNLTRALAAHLNISIKDAEPYVHDVLNVFMCTGFTRDTGQYFMKASPVRAGDYIEFIAEIDLLAVLSACPGGDCGSEHTSDVASCFPLEMSVRRSSSGARNWVSPPRNAYDRSHGT